MTEQGRRWEVAALIGPCSETEANFLAETLAEISGPLGGSVQRGPWNENANAPESEAKLLAALAAAEAENARLRDVLADARPYVFNRTGTADWRGETALDTLSRVDAALASRPGEGAAT